MHILPVGDDVLDPVSYNVSAPVQLQVDEPVRKHGRLHVRLPGQ